MTGGCILGTLRQLGEGNLGFLVVLASFAPGMAIVVYGLNPLLEKGYNVQGFLLSDLLGLPAAAVTLPLAAIALAWYARIRPRKKKARGAAATGKGRAKESAASTGETGTAAGIEAAEADRRAVLAASGSAPEKE